MRNTTVNAPRAAGAVVPLSQATDAATVGHKAATLGRLLRAGHRVPAGFVVPAGAPLEGRSREEIGAALADLGGPVAVRSSGVAEDLGEASFAGQYETMLGVDGLDDVTDAIAHVRASAGAAAERGYADSGGAMPVLVQQLVAADAAGVAFSANPVTGDRGEVLVSAVRGLGDRLVSGEAASDDWVVRGDTVTRTAAPEDAVDAEVVGRVAELTRRIERELGTPVDVEWALADGQVHLLQARPITALPVPPTVTTPEGHWFKDTTHFLEPISPLAATVYIPVQEAILPDVFERFGLLLETVRFQAIGHEVYGHPVPVGGEGGPTPPGWLMGLLVRVVPPLRRRLKAARHALDSGLPARTLVRWEAEWKPHLRARIGDLAAVAVDQLSDLELDRHLERLVELMTEGQRIHFDLFLPYVMALHELASVADELLGWDLPEVVTLVGGLSEATSEPGRDLARIAALAREDAAARAILDDRDLTSSGMLAQLAGQAPDVHDAIQGHLRRFGPRLVGYDLGTPALEERPGLVLDTLRDLVARDVDPQATTRRLAAQRDEAADAARQELQRRGVAADDRRRFEDALERARYAWPIREDNLLYTDGLPVGLLRRAVLEVGRRLVARGELRAAEDVVLLEYPELRELARGGGLDEPPARDRVDRRRAEIAWVRAHPGPDEYGQDPGPPPPMDAMPEAIQRTTGAMLWMMEAEFDPAAAGETADGLRGTPGSPGRAEGTARVVRGEHEFDRLTDGDVLVCPVTNPAWSTLFPKVSALVADGGGVLAHAAILAREYGVPAVLATGVATQRLHDGDRVVVDGNAGSVTIVDCPHDTDDGNEEAP